jgi:hypothetical protein
VHVLDTDGPGQHTFQVSTYVISSYGVVFKNTVHTNNMKQDVSGVISTN